MAKEVLCGSGQSGKIKGTSRRTDKEKCDKKRPEWKVMSKGISCEGVRECEQYRCKKRYRPRSNDVAEVSEKTTVRTGRFVGRTAL